MKTTLLICCFFLLEVRFLNAQDTLANNTKIYKRGILVYVELYGHNYYGFESKNSKGLGSLNLGYRQKIVNNILYLTASVGWGTFKERHSSQIPSQPRIYFYERTHFVPFELTAELGKNRHFLEIGFCFTQAWGNHTLVYFGTSANQVKMTIKNGSQIIPRFGYTFSGFDGLTIRLSFTPHIIPEKYNFFAEYSVAKPGWIPIGLSIGYLF